MARLFIFAIGGTGSRVLKSLIMLLAAGVKPASDVEFEIVPIIIDPHKDNDDLKRTKTLLNHYEKITKAIMPGNGFFNTRVSTLNSFVVDEDQPLDSFTFNLQEVNKVKFKDYIDLDDLNPANKALAEILFSGKSINERGDKIDLLDIEMQIGFVGNPNIGSVVLNQFRDSKEFNVFAQTYNENDRIFIISSIFGGTGAAGFPTILKNIREAPATLPNRGLLKNSKIGAISVLPYFNIDSPENSPIKKSHFIAKTKSALHYYKENITGNSSINALYYIADDHNGKAYTNDPGHEGQQNDAHFIEVAAATAIIDFLELSDEELNCRNGVASEPVFKEFAIRNDSLNVTLTDFEDVTERHLAGPLTQFTLLKKFVDEEIQTAVHRQPWVLNGHKIDNQFFLKPFYKTHFIGFLEAYGEWLKELSENNRGFIPFNLNGPLKTLITNKKVETGWFRKKLNYDYFNSELNKTHLKKGGHYVTPEQKLINLFFETTAAILVDRYGFSEK